MDVQSSAITSVEYDHDTHTMTITFKGGNVYRYDYVPRRDYEDLMAASSKGTHFAKHIRPNFAGRKV